MFNISDRVEVSYDGMYNGRLGIVEEIYPAMTMDKEAVYTIGYLGSMNRRMFKESELKLTNE